MSRHSKNNTAAACFTYEERQRLNYGTQKVRVGRDSLRDYDACYLCLQRAREPLCCEQGHLACKECLYENVLAQKKEIQRLEKIVEIQKRQDIVKIEEKEEKAKNLLVNDFIDSQNHANERKTKIVADSDGAKRLRITASSEDSERIVQEVKKKVNQDLENAKNAVIVDENSKVKPVLSSYWIPSLCPTGVEQKVEDVKRVPVCTIDNKPINLKKLINLNFFQQNGEQGFSCPCCLKTLSNSLKITVLKRCGHVFCSGCAQKIVKSIPPNCLVCDKVTQTSDFVNLHHEGTGFSGGQGKVVVEKYTAAFQ